MAAPLVGLATNALFATIGGLQSRKAARKAEKITNQRLGQVNTLFETGRSALEGRLAKAEPYIMQLLESAQQGYADQVALADDVGQEGYRAIQDALTFGGGRINQNFAQRGFSGSSAHGAAFRSLGSDMSRAFGNLTSELAGVRSNMLRGALQQLMQGQGSVADFHAGAGSAMAGQYGDHARTLAGIGHQAPQGIGAGWGSIGAFLGQALDEWGGFGGGGGAPAAPGYQPGIAPDEPGPPLPPGWNS